MNVKNGTELATGSLKPSRLKKTTFLVLYKSAIYDSVRMGLEILKKSVGISPITNISV